MAHKITELEPVELPAEVAERFEEQIAQAEAELDAHRTSIRFSTKQLATIKQAALKYGMPYQTYVKDAAFRRAVTDLRALKTLEAVGSDAPPLATELSENEI